MTETFTTKIAWKDNGLALINLINKHGVVVYSLELYKDTVQNMMDKQLPRCDSTISVAEVENDMHRKAVYTNSYGSRGESRVIRCTEQGTHFRHTGTWELNPIGGRRPDSMQPTIIRIFW